MTPKGVGEYMAIFIVFLLALCALILGVIGFCVTIEDDDPGYKGHERYD